MIVDVTSDIHLDFWIGINGSPDKQKMKMHHLVEELSPADGSDTLIIAGDIGHYNAQNETFFKVLREYYKDVVWVHGNHDLYMVSSSVRRNFLNNSFARLNDMVERSNKIDGVHYLNGNTVEIDGVKITGCGMWYNYDYAKEVYQMTDPECERMWNDYLNDANLIRVAGDNALGQINNLEYFKEQYELLEKVYQEGDIIVSHVSPSWSNLIQKYQIPSTTFYVFDGREMLSKLDDTKIWVFGHTHEKYLYRDASGCTLICKPVDYAPSWDWQNLDLSDRAFVTIEVGKFPSYDDIFKDIN